VPAPIEIQDETLMDQQDVAAWTSGTSAQINPFPRPVSLDAANSSKNSTNLEGITGMVQLCQQISEVKTLVLPPADMNKLDELLKLSSPSTGVL